MIKIDELPRITLRDCSIFFRQVRQIEEALPTASDVMRGNNPELPAKIKGTFTAWGIKYEIWPILSGSSGRLEIESFLFEWGKDKQYRQEIRLHRQPSNLGISSVIYFLCPHTGRKCRKLYTDGKIITSRWAFKHTYSQRNKSRKSRELDRLMNHYDKDPYRKYGKPEYRGKRTPYGERLWRIYTAPQPTDNVWAAFLPKRIGRPPKWLQSTRTQNKGRRDTFSSQWYNNQISKENGADGLKTALNRIFGNCFLMETRRGEPNTHPRL